MQKYPVKVRRAIAVITKHDKLRKRIQNKYYNKRHVLETKRNAIQIKIGKLDDAEAAVANAATVTRVALVKELIEAARTAGLNPGAVIAEAFNPTMITHSEPSQS